MRRFSIALLVVACGGNRNDSAPPTPPPSASKYDTCADDAVPIYGGGCTAIGVRECAKGFVADGIGGCTATIPTCGKGTFATVGEATCHEVMPCGAAPYGDVPAGTVVFVDAAFTGTSDGTRDRPFAKVQAAIDAAPLDATIALADGVYVESLLIGKRIKLHGRCPNNVEVKGVGARAIAVRAEARIEGVAVTGAGQGITIDGSVVSLDKVWVHDTAASGGVVLAPGTGSIITRSLIEKTRNTGIYVEASDLRIADTVIRDISVASDGRAGNGVQSQIGKDGTVATITISSSIIERTIGPAAQSFGSDIMIDGSLIRDVTGRKDVASCVVAQKGTAAPRVPNLSIVGSVLEGCPGAGVRVDSGMMVFERSTLRKSKPDLAMNLGLGLDVSGGATVNVRDSLIAETRLAGIFIGGSDARIERSIVRDVSGQASNGNSGIGVAVLTESASANVTIDQSLILHTRTVGLLVGAAKVELLGSVIRDVKPEESTGKFGDGIELGGGSTTSITESLVREVARAGVVVRASTATLARDAMSCTAVDLAVDGKVGLDDRGGNVCGCTTPMECVAQPTALEPVPFTAPRS